MPFDVSVQREPGLLRYRVSGPASLKNYFDLIEQAVQDTRDGPHRVLVDLRGVAGRLAFTDQFFIGEVVGEKLGHLQRLATLVAHDPDSYHSPKVANRLGVHLVTFTDESAALAWLQAAD